MDKTRRRSRVLHKIAKGVEVIDLDLEPDRQHLAAHLSEPRIKDEEHDSNPSAATIIKQEIDVPPIDTSVWSGFDKSNPIIIMDDDIPNVNLASQMPSTTTNEADDTTPNAMSSPNNSPTGVMPEDLDVASAPEKSIFGVNQSSQEATTVAAGGTSSGTPDRSSHLPLSPAMSTATGPPSAPMLDPVRRVIPPTMQERLKAAQLSAKERLQEKQNALAHKKEATAKTSPSVSKVPRTVTRSTRASSDDDDSGTYRGGGGSSRSQRKASSNGVRHSGGKAAGSGKPPSNHNSSDDDDDDDADMRSNDGLFVPEGAENRDEDGDMYMHDDETEAQFLDREKREVEALAKKVKQAERTLKSKRKSKAGEEVIMEAEITHATLKRQYDAALVRQAAAQAPDEGDDDDEDEMPPVYGDGLGGLDDDEEEANPALFENFETRGQPVHKPGEYIFNSDNEDDDQLAAYERIAQEKRDAQLAAGGDASETEIRGSRKKPTKRTRRKKADTTSAKRNGKKDDGDDGVQTGRVDKAGKGKGKKGKKAAPSLLNAASLWGSDVIRDAAGNAGYSPLPALQSTNRSQALIKLISSLPQEARAAGRADKRALLSAAQDFRNGRAIMAVPFMDKGEGSWRLRRMKSLLKDHQLLGTAFMRRREKDTIEPKGGICADQMGLGKTVMMIANILDGLPEKKRTLPRATLIVVPNALLEQWRDEIKRHCEPKALTVIIHQGAHKTEDPADLEAADVVITTYLEVRKSYPKCEYPVELQTADEKNRWWRWYYEENRETVHKAKYLRVVLDEAQQIKNHKSHTSQACRALDAEHRWALSGTPIQNTLRELYPYFKFLKVEHTGSFRTFCQNFIGNEKQPSKIGVDRLNQMLGRIMIRRTHADKVMGAPIVVLPKASQQIRWVKFNDVERIVYDVVRTRMIKRINKLSRSRKLDANYSHVLTMLLRLRQMTGHILTVEEAMRDLLEQEDHQKIYDIAAVANSSEMDSIRARQITKIRNLLAQGPSVHDNNRPSATMLAGVRDRSRHDSVDPTEDNAMTGDQRTQTGIGGSHGLEYDFFKYLATLREAGNIDEVNNRTTCCLCGDKPQDGQVTSCYHVYCRECLESMVEEAIGAGQDQGRCKECGQVWSETHPWDQMDFERPNQERRTRRAARQGGEYESESDSDVEMQKSGNKWKDRTHRMRQKKKIDWIDQEGKNILPSAKTIEIKAQILNWIDEDKQVKVIIFTQFLNMIRILEKVCIAEGWKCTFYHGGISKDRRNKNIKLFQEDSSIRVLLASTKSGGVGLNLTMAQKVIIVDPWWNSSVEQQAFCRVFRIGQVSETAMTRFVVENTVDQNMMEMQERKQDEIDQVMDSSKKSNHKLEVKDLMRLFGEVGEDEEGLPFIFVDNKDGRVNLGADDSDIEDEV